jgi:hypothetical protein
MAEMKAMLVSVDPSLEEQAERQMHHLYDIFANLTKLENDAATAGMLKKGKVKTQADKIAGDLQDYFMRTVRDFADLFKKEQKDIISVLPRLQMLKPEEIKAYATSNVPSVAAGSPEDFQKLFSFAETFSKRSIALYQQLSRDTKTLLDENKRTVETYERHVSIDKGEVATSASTDDISTLSIMNLILISEKLKTERTYLDSRKDEVSRMLSVHLVSDIDSLSVSVETAARLGLELPVDFNQKLRVLARDASKATNLTTLMSLDSQLQSARTQMASMLRDRIINIKHEVTSKIAEGGIPTTADIIPQGPTAGIESEDIASLLSSLGRMGEWTGSVRIALKDRTEDILQEIDKAVEVPADAGIKDLPAVKQFLADSRAQLDKADIDALVRIYLKARTMQEDERKFITDKIRSYMARFNELATSADRVLDYAQLSKKAPKVEDLQTGGNLYLLQALGQLKQAVDSGVATFRDACNQEIEAIIEDLQTIKPAYAEIFLPITEKLDEGKQKLQKLNEFGEIRAEMKNIKDTILIMAKEALENLRYRLGVKIRLAAAKLMGSGVVMPPEVQEGIAELNNIGVAAETVFSLPAIARKMIEVYEQKISSVVIALLMEEVTKLETSFAKAKNIGVDLDKELQTLANLRMEPPEELEGAAESFDRLQKLTTSPVVLQKIKSRASEAYVQINNAVKAFEQQGMGESVERLKTLIEQVPTQLASQPKHVFESLDVCLTLATIQEEMINMIKTMSNKDKQEYEKTLRERSKYYSTIERVYEKHPKDFSALVYPLDKMKKMESDLASARMLDDALKIYSQLKEQRKGWIDKAEKMDEWHKSLKMYMTGFSPGAGADQRQKFVDEAIKKIKDTYSREDISSYLSWAVKELVASMMEKRA